MGLEYGITRRPPTARLVAKEMASLGLLSLSDASTSMKIDLHSDHRYVRISGCLDCVISFEGQYQLPPDLDRRPAWETLSRALDVD